MRYTPWAAASAGGKPRAARSGTGSRGRVTNGAIRAGRARKAAAVSGHTSAGSHGVRVSAAPATKFSCSNCSAWGSA